MVKSSFFNTLLSKKRIFNSSPAFDPQVKVVAPKKINFKIALTGFNTL